MRIFEKCCICKNKAKWLYMPSSDVQTFYQKKFSYKKDYFCEIHVPRGCSCNYQEAIYIDSTNEKYFLLEDTKKDVKIDQIKFFQTKRNDKGWFDTKNRITLLNEPPIEIQNDPNYLIEFTVLDKNKKESPCCEFLYSKHGWLIK